MTELWDSLPSGTKVFALCAVATVAFGAFYGLYLLSIRIGGRVVDYARALGFVRQMDREP